MLLVMVAVVLHWNACFYLVLVNHVGRAADAWVHSQSISLSHATWYTGTVAFGTVQHSHEETERVCQRTQL